MPDRISYLPEEIRDRILSNLPTEEAVRSSILSSQWKTVCSTLSHYHFNLFSLETNQETNIFQRFECFLIQTLGLHDIRSHIQTLKFSAILKEEEDDLLPFINAWISHAVLANIRELQLLLYGQNLRLNKLPSCLLTCETLETLALRNVDLVLPKTIEFPSLKNLSLSVIKFMDDKSETDRFFASFPALEYLNMKHCKSKHALTVDAPKLKVLDLDMVCIEGEIRISSTFLSQFLHIFKEPRCGTSTFLSQFLHIFKEPRCGTSAPNIVLDSNSTIYYASFTVIGPVYSTDMPENVRIQTAKILAGPYHVVKLALLGKCVELLSRDPDLLYHLPTSVASVKHLQLEMNKRNHALIITFLLRIYPNLETFNLLLKGSEFGCSLDIEGYRGSENLPNNGILEILRIVTIKSFGGNDNELDLVRFLLENASTLEKMNIEGAFEAYWHSDEFRSKKICKTYKATETSGKVEYENFRNTTIDKIQSFPRASPLVAVSFSPE